MKTVVKSLRNLILSFCFLIFLCGIQVFANELGYDECSTDPTDEKLCQVKIVAGKKEGKEVCRAIDNQKIILREAHFIGGQLDGAFICRSFTNAVIIKASYREGKLHGEYRGFATNRGNDKVKISWMIRYFQAGKQEGVHFYADQNGKVLDYLPGCWSNGDSDHSNYSYCLNLSYSEYQTQVHAYLKKKVSERSADLNRKIDSKFKNGKPQFRATLVNGQYEGAYEKFFESGKPRLQAVYKQGKIVSENEFYESGAKQSTKKFINGKLSEQNVYYENGKVGAVLKVSFDKNFRTEVVQAFSDRGKRRLEYTRKYFDKYDWQGLYVGPYRAYDQEGNITIEINYVDGKRHGKSIYYGPKNIEEETWQQDQLRSKIIIDSATKKPLEKIEYMNDGSEKSRVIISPRKSS